MSSKAKLGVLLALVSVTGCARAVKPDDSVRSSKGANVRVERGMASWYGDIFHGRTTANGEKFDKNALTAAHRTRRFGSCVRVLNLGNGRSVEVRINDRGPYARQRVIDVSEAAARELDFIESGVAKVELWPCE